MKLDFLHPEYGIPCFAEWDEEGQVVLLDIQNYDEAFENYPLEVVEEARRWCMRNGANCQNKEAANRHLAFLNIPSRFQ